MGKPKLKRVHGVPPEALKDFAGKFSSDLNDLMSRSIDLWAPIIGLRETVSLVAQCLAGRGAVLERQTEVMRGSFREMVKEAERYLDEANGNG
jgi:hypothetical protein